MRRRRPTCKRSFSASSAERSESGIAGLTGSGAAVSIDRINVSDSEAHVDFHASPT